MLSQGAHYARFCGISRAWCSASSTQPCVRWSQLWTPRGLTKMLSEHFKYMACMMVHLPFLAWNSIVTERKRSKRQPSDVSSKSTNPIPAWSRGIPAGTPELPRIMAMPIVEHDFVVFGVKIKLVGSVLLPAGRGTSRRTTLSVTGHFS